MQFTGIDPEVFEFYVQLEQHNERSWWAEHGHAYKEQVLPTVVALLSELEPEWMPMTVYRPYRNVRFSPDKTPYKTACGAVGGDMTGIMHYFQIGGSWVMPQYGAGLRTSRGMYSFSSDQLLRYYDAVHDDEGGGGTEGAYLAVRTERPPRRRLPTTH